jgi:predicted alpha/beta hydrolase family esterase
MPFAEQSAFSFGQLSVLRVTGNGHPAGTIVGEEGADPSRLALDFHGWPHGGRWAMQLDTALCRAGDPTLVVAQGLACLAVAWWAQLSPKSYTQRVAGALFVSPLSFSPSEASAARSLRPSPGTKLPFPSIVANAASPIIEQVLELADIWGGQFVDLDASRAAAARTLQDHPLAAQSNLLGLIDMAAGRGGAPTHLEPSLLDAAAPLVLARK